MIKPMDTWNILVIAEVLASLLHELSEQRGIIEAEIADAERVNNDIEHRIESPDCKYQERARLATKLAESRRYRRELKDWQTINKLYIEFLGDCNGTKALNMLDNLIGRGRKTRDLAAKRAEATP